MSDAYCPTCGGRGHELDHNNDPVTCPDCAGSGKAENSITANEKPLRLTQEQADLRKEITKDMGEFMSAAIHVTKHLANLHIRLAQLENRMDALRRLAGEDNT